MSVRQRPVMVADQKLISETSQVSLLCALNPVIQQLAV